MVKLVELRVARYHTKRNTADDDFEYSHGFVLPEELSTDDGSPSDVPARTPKRRRVDQETIQKKSTLALAAPARESAGVASSSKSTIQSIDRLAKKGVSSSLASASRPSGGPLGSGYKPMPKAAEPRPTAATAAPGLKEVPIAPAHMSIAKAVPHPTRKIVNDCSGPPTASLAAGHQPTPKITALLPAASNSSDKHRQQHDVPTAPTGGSTDNIIVATPQPPIQPNAKSTPSDRPDDEDIFRFHVRLAWSNFRPMFALDESTTLEEIITKVEAKFHRRTEGKKVSHLSINVRENDIIDWVDIQPGDTETWQYVLHCAKRGKRERLDGTVNQNAFATRGW